ncbi:MAG: amidohydrolase family protein [Candidatus Eiseniibacteriota bacterium]
MSDPLALALVAALVVPAPAVPAAAQRQESSRGAVPTASSDLAGARRVFEANLDAIRRRDRDAYLACYLRSEGLARTGPTGIAFGYAALDSSAGRGWPDHFEALDLRLAPVRPGMVYGTYRYRVRYGAVEQSGLSERLFVGTPEGWRIAVTTAFPALAGVPPPPRAIVGATLVDGTGGPPVPDAVVVIRDGRVECAGPRARCPIPAGVDTLDARGMWVLPGLVDAHVHYSQTGWADGRPDALDLRAEHPYESVEARLRAHPERFHRAWLASGVTAVFDVGGFPWTLRMRDDAERSTEAPHVSTAGPLLSTIDHWLNLPAERQFMVLRDTASAREGVRYLEAIGADAVKVWFIVRPGSDFAAMERAVLAAGEAARTAGLPLIVHATGLREAKVALRAGAKLLVHSVQDLPVDDEFLDLCRKSGATYCPTLSVRDGYVRLAQSVASGAPPSVDDPNGVVDSLTLAHLAATPATARRLGQSRPVPRPTATDSLHRTMEANLMRVHGAGIPVAMGTDAGNPLTLHGPAIHAEMEWMQRAGMRPMDVIVAATRNGARAMGREAEFGTIEPGMLADLLLVGADPTRDVANLRRVMWVVRGGVARSLAELKAAIRQAGAR